MLKYIGEHRTVCDGHYAVTSAADNTATDGPASEAANMMFFILGGIRRSSRVEELYSAVLPKFISWAGKVESSLEEKILLMNLEIQRHSRMGRGPGCIKRCLTRTFEQFFRMILSQRRDKIGVTDMGRKSAHSVGLGTLATGVITNYATLSLPRNKNPVQI